MTTSFLTLSGFLECNFVNYSNFDEIDNQNLRCRVKRGNDSQNKIFLTFFEPQNDEKLFDSNDLYTLNKNHSEQKTNFTISNLENTIKVSKRLILILGDYYEGYNIAKNLHDTEILLLRENQSLDLIYKYHENTFRVRGYDSENCRKFDIGVPQRYMVVCELEIDSYTYFHFKVITRASFCQ